MKIDSGEKLENNWTITTMMTSDLKGQGNCTMNGFMEIWDRWSSQKTKGQTQLCEKLPTAPNFTLYLNKDLVQKNTHKSWIISLVFIKILGSKLNI